MLGRRVTLNNPVWSLDYEMRMSLVLPVLLLPMCRLGGLGAALVGAGLLAASVVLGTAWLPDVLHAVGQTAAFGAMFLLGAWLGGRVEALQAVRLRAASLVLGLLAWAVFFLCWRDMLLAFGAALLIGAVLVPGPVARFCMTRPARFLGRISYSLYLVHVPVLLTMLAVLHGVLPTVFIVALAPAAGIGVAMLFYSAIERPCHRLARTIGSV
jgi:peptidoglycan/LPS O-acetylase OafA/YrhL